MVTIDLRNLTLTGPPGEVDSFLRIAAKTITRKEMAVLAEVSERTIGRWMQHPHFPAIRSGRVSRLEFLRFILERSRQIKQ